MRYFYLYTKLYGWHTLQSALWYMQYAAERLKNWFLFCWVIMMCTGCQTCKTATNFITHQIAEE